MKVVQATVLKAGTRFALALFVLSMILFLPAARAGSTITLTSPNALAGGHFGESVSVSGTTVVVGAQNEPAGGTFSAGNAYVLDTTIGLITTLTSQPPQAGGDFGRSVSISGTTVVVGSSLETAGGQVLAGNAYVFDATDGSFIAKLIRPTPLAGGHFGESVSVSGTTVVVGAPDESAGGQDSAGNAYVFDATDGSFITELTSPTPQAGGEFGFSVSVSGTTVVVGAPFETAGGPNLVGNAYVFDATDGSFITELTSPTPQAGGEFGFSVSISGTTVVVGAPGEMVGPLLQAGHAYVLDASTGASITMLTSPYAQAYGHFGYSVAVGSTTVVVGAPDETAGGQLGAGHTYTFDATTGFLITTLTSPNPQEGGFFGGSVAVTEDDPIVVVGAAGESGGGYPIAGHAYIFF